MPLPLRDYQVQDLGFIIANPRAGLLHDPGGGKTPTVCVAMEWRWNEAREKTIWVMPSQIIAKNIRELLTFTNFTPEMVSEVKGNTLDPDAVVYLMTADRLRSHGDGFLVQQPSIKMLVADELHMFWSTNDSKRTQAWYRLMRKIPRFIGMTGTLIRGRLNSAYPFIHVIEPRYYPSEAAFMSYHAVYDENSKLAGWQNTDRLAEIIAKHSIKRSFTSIYGPESKVIVPEFAAMAPKQRAAYAEFEDKAMLELEDEFLSAPTGGVFAIRCRQIMGHPETFGLATGETTGKDELLALHLVNHQHSGAPLIIYSALVPEQERIARLVKAHGMEVALLNGETPTAKRGKIDNDFCSGKIQVLVGSPQIATVGFNWDHVSHIIFASMDYQADTFTQAYRRAIRGVRSTPLLITVLQYEKSIDQRIAAIVNRKSRLENRIDASREVLAL
jgi:superfamily II DNA or RNA helicase